VLSYAVCMLLSYALVVVILCVSYGFQFSPNRYLNNRKLARKATAEQGSRELEELFRLNIQLKPKQHFNSKINLIQDEGRVILANCTLPHKRHEAWR
jgi:putative exporter of polyketide antibiotics